jgi:hypothetical protein
VDIYEYVLKLGQNDVIRNVEIIKIKNWDNYTVENKDNR